MYFHLPNYIENNVLFRTLFLIRKLFFIRCYKKSYSQYGEDIALGHLLNLKEEGFYVDVGCFHPKKYNNTYHLYKNGWRGINIDLDEIKIQAFNILRRKDRNICTAISNNPKEKIDIYSFGFYTLINTLDKATAEKRSDYVKKTVKNSTLSRILSEEQIKRIDVLSVDAEGADLEVLKSIDFQKCDIDIIIVELHESFLEDILKSQLYKFLISLGYSMVNWTGPSLIFRQVNKKLIQIECAP